MKKYLLFLLVSITYGCVPYSKRTDIGNCLTVNASNEQVIKSINKNNKKTIKEVSIIFKHSNYSTDKGGRQCLANATYTDGSSEQGWVSVLFANGSTPQKFDFISNEEKTRQEELIKNERERKNKGDREKILQEQKSSEQKGKIEYKNASLNEYPFLVEVYCYNKINLEAFAPSACGISAHGPVGIGPTNLYDKNMTSLNVMVRNNFDITVEMAEPEMTTFNTRFRNNTLEVSRNEPRVTLGINVTVRNRHSNKVIYSERGDYYNRIHITN